LTALSLSPQLGDAASFWLAVAGRPQSSRLDESSVLLPSRAEAEALEIRLPEASDAQLATQAGIAVVFDGRLHSTGPLLRAIDEPSARVSSEAELVLRAYRARGLDAVPLVHGEFALLICEESSGDVVLARDRLGSRPLCYGLRDGRLFVSPSPELVAGAVDTEVNAVAVAEWVLTASLESSESFYAHVSRLRPGHVLVRRDGRVTVARYWRPPMHRRLDWDPREAHEEFDRLVRRSVRRAVEHGRVGVFLSGGIDSALVAAVAAEESRLAGGVPPLALSMRFPYPDADEATVQRAIAKDLELDTVMVTLDEAAGPDGTLIAGLRQSERDWLPLINPWQSAYDTLTLEGIHRGCTSIVSGEGGNVIMEPTWDEISDLVARLRVVHLGRLAKDWARYAPRARRAAILRAALRHSAKRGRRRLFAAAASRSTHPSLQAAFRGAAARRGRRGIPAWAVPDERLRRELTDRRGSALLRTEDDSEWPRMLDADEAATMLESSFLVARRLGVSISDVYYDPGLFSFRAQAPVEALLYGGRYKGLGQASYRGLVPDGSVELLRTASFDRAFETLLARELPGALRYLGGLRELARLGVIRSDEFMPLIRGSSLSPVIGYYRVWQVLACEAWLRARS
jgi:hypothetical protein